MHVYVDTDISLGTPGAEIDDGAALIALLRAAPGAVLAVGTVFGNAPVDTTTQNAARLLDALGTGIPLGRGAERALVQDNAWFEPWQHGYGPTPPHPMPDALPHAVDLLIDTVRRAPEPVTLLALGPLTNLALALRLAPDILEGVREVVTMGGSFGADPQPEFNAHSDPEAAHIVLGAPWPVRLLGLEVTRQVLFTRADFAALPAADPAAGLLRQQAPGWIERVEGQGWERGGCGLHDAVAAAALLHPEWYAFEPAAVEVVLHPAAQRGATRVARPAAASPARLRVAAGLDAPAVKSFILNLLKGRPA